MDPKEREEALAPVKIREVSGDKCLQRHRDDFVVREAEVRIEVGGELHSRLFCLPAHFEELAIGHLDSGAKTCLNV